MNDVLLLYVAGVVGVYLAGAIFVVDDWQGRAGWTVYAVLWPLWLVLAAILHVREELALLRRSS